MVSLGEQLKRERELREISLREIADSTKISVRFLEGIENDNYRILPGGVFNRNFLRAYASFIGLDPEIIVRKYQQIHGSVQEDADEKMLHPLTATTPETGGKSKVYVVAAFVVLILLLVSMYFIFRNRNEKANASSEIIFITDGVDS